MIAKGSIQNKGVDQHVLFMGPLVGSHQKDLTFTTWDKLSMGALWNGLNPHMGMYDFKGPHP